MSNNCCSVCQLPAYRRRNELEQRFGVIGRDVRMRQRRSAAERMRRLRETAMRIDAQGLFLDTAQACTQSYFWTRIGEPVQLMGKQFSNDPFSLPRATLPNRRHEPALYSQRRP